LAEMESLRRAEAERILREREEAQAQANQMKKEMEEAKRKHKDELAE